MENNYLYFWDKLGASGKRQLLGDVQINDGGLNMSFVIDGTKDSSKMIVWSYSISEVVKPNTVVWHENTNTWWIVSNDKIEKRPNDNGWLYIHNLQLEGAIELLNARDLVDCGFNQNTYTISMFLERLFNLSSYEITNYFNFGNNLDEDKQVDYIKTFENYTLSSALREFLDGYNCVGKLRFYQYPSGNDHPITMSFLDIIPKTGNINREQKDINEVFNDIKEIKTINKNSFGTTVVSNAENVVSTKPKLYPSVGLTRISGEDFYITPESACIRLPSKVNTVQYVDMVKGKIQVCVAVNKTDEYGAYFQGAILGETSFDTASVLGFNKAIDFVKSTLMQQGPAAEWLEQNTDDEFWNNAKGASSLEVFMSNFSFRLYDVEQYDPISSIFVSSHTINEFYRLPSGNKPFVLGEKRIRDCVKEPKEVMYWERGSNLIKGFDFFDYHGVSNVITSKDSNGVQFLGFSITTATGTWNYKVIFGDYAIDSSVAGYIKPDKVRLSLTNTYYKIKYIPMGDIKIKYDNENYGKDIQLYNQNGKFTDGVALSKLLVSYKDEIVSDNITKCQIGYDFDSMSKVGDIVINQGYKYVINNVSLNIFCNEENGEMGYFIVGEYTLSKNVSTKSLLTSPNTNIRDYGIPQSFNIKRKELFRDFYELSFESDESADNERYLDLSKVMNFGFYYQNYVSHTGIIKLTFENAFGGGGETYDGGVAPSSNVWYYQVESTVYYLKKSMYEVIDFQDNNVIGYDCQNVTCGFDIRRLFDITQQGTPNIDIINTPISYVDDNGQFKDVEIAMCSSEQVMNIYDQYIQNVYEDIGRLFTKTLYNRCVFIPKEVYDLALLNCDFEMNDINYKKDALEVPVFEYSCQIDDSDDVIIGENVLDNFEDDYRYIYELAFVQHNRADNNTWKNFATPSDVLYSNYELYINATQTRKSGRIVYSTNDIRIYGYDNLKIKTNEEVVNYSNRAYLHTLAQDIASLYSDNKVDLVVIRHTIPNGFTTTNGVVDNVKTDLMLVIKNAQNCPEQLETLKLQINHYLLK